ncbi:MAG: hypothetical protein SVO26_05085, partial [Chloroflexota bacterium]|nr:hypothetical protein [Chloroflexota bacterium]
MDKAWAYAGLQGWGSGTQVEFLKPLLDELVKWTKSVSEDYLWFPGGYTEWTLAGHFAVMADRCDFIPFQEYTLKLPTSKGPDSSEKIVRPDLYIASRNKDGQPSVLFEFKARNMSLGEEWKEPVNIRNRIQEAYDE